MPAQPYRQPGTLQVAGFLCGAVLGSLRRGLALRLSAARGGPVKHEPLLAGTLNWGGNVASLKFVQPQDRPVIGGGLI